MGIMDRLKRLFSGTTVAPAGQGPVQTGAQSAKTRPGTLSNNGPVISDGERLAVQQRSEALVREFNKSLSAANTSTNLKIREYQLQAARKGLTELKALEKQYPFLHLTSLEGVEASILVVEAETNSLSRGELPSATAKNSRDKVQPGSNASRRHLSASDEQTILECLQSCLRVVNESIDIARKSKNIETKISRLDVARSRLKEAQEQARQFALEIDGFDKAEAEINRIDEAIISGSSVPLLDWAGDVCNGFIFCATLQLRTPLRVLLRHGEICPKSDGQQPQIALEQWEGVWLPKSRTWREMGIDMDEMDEGTHASLIGQIRPSEYMPFLVAVREIVEMSEPIGYRLQELRKMLSSCPWQNYVEKHGGIEAIVQHFFPRHIAPFPKLPESTRENLLKLGLLTPTRIATTTDERLLEFKGIGPAKLKAIRAHFADIAKDPDADRVENVYR